MDKLPDAIFKKWGHSFEEDQEDLTVSRPMEYAFPLGRGRTGIEFKRNGEFIDWQIGRGDAKEPLTGQWHVKEPGQVQVTFEGKQQPRTYEILEVKEDVLKMRQQQ